MNIQSAERARANRKRFTLPKHGNTTSWDRTPCSGMGVIQGIGENRPFSTADSQPPSYPAIQLACDGVNCGIIFLANLEEFPKVKSIRYQTDADFFI